MKIKRWEVTLLTGEEEARLVHNALINGDHETLSLLLSTLGAVRRERLARHYRALYGRKLSRDMEDMLAGDYLHICLSVIADPNTILVKEIHDLLLEFPTPQEELLAAMLCERSKKEISVINEAYEKRFAKSLPAEMDSFLSPSAAKWLKLLVTWSAADCCCDLQQASKDTQRLLTLGMGTSYGHEGPVIASLLQRRCSSHMRNVFAELRRLGRSPQQLLEPALPLPTRKRIDTIVQAIDKPELFNAKALWFSKSESGKFWRNVLSIRITRTKEFYKKVELHFNDLYNTRIQDEIKRDSGDNVSFLLKKLTKL